MIDQVDEAEPHGCSEENSKQQKEGETGQGGAFLEEEMLISMEHSRWDVPSLSSGGIGASCTIDQYFPEVGHPKKSVKEVNLPISVRMEGNPLDGLVLGSLEMGQPSHVNDEMDCPFECEFLLDGDGLPNRDKGEDATIENSVTLEEGIEDTDSFGATQGSNTTSIEKNGNEDLQSPNGSHGSSVATTEKVPQSLLPEPEVNFQCGTIEIVIPFKEELLEAQNTWDIGKTLGVKSSNGLTMIDALSKIRECQDFSLPQKRGRPRKNKGGN